ncbi:MAG: hypothetical protein IKH49_07155 [Bacteroidales bacterium]|nr:hypothetical protein [Bacteroidales bacterium]
MIVTDLPVPSVVMTGSAPVESNAVKVPVSGVDFERSSTRVSFSVTGEAAKFFSVNSSVVTSGRNERLMEPEASPASTFVAAYM